MPEEDDFQVPQSGGDQQKDAAEASRRKAKWLIRLIAAGCFLIGGMDLGLYLVQSQRNHSAVNLLRCLWLSIPLVAGVMLLVKTRALADWIEEWLDQ